MSEAEIPNERTSLLRKDSRRSPSVTTGEFSDPKRWWSIRVMYLTMFLSSVTFTLTISSIWPFLQVLDSNATADFLGWVVAAYSLGQLVASPLFGIWANVRNQSREPLAVSITLGIGANIMYAYLESIPGNIGMCMIIARGITGFGAGNVAVVRSYVAGATTLKERTGAMANVSICQSIGFILGPVIQAAFVPMSYPGPVSHPAFHLNMYTAPALLGAILCFVNVVLLFTVFREYRVPDEIIVSNIQSSYEESVMEYKPDYFAVISCIVIFFAVLFVFTIFETIATPLCMDMFAWTKAQTTLYVGIILSGCGVEAIGVFIVLKMLSRRFNERYLLIGGFILCLIGYFVQIPWGSGKVVIAPAVEVTSQTVTPTDIIAAIKRRDLSQFDDVINNNTLTGLLPHLNNTVDGGTLATLIHNFTNTTSTVNSTVTDIVMSTARTFIEPMTLTAAEEMTTDLTLETALSITTTEATTVITPDVLSTAKTLTSKSTTVITPDNLSTAKTLTSTSASTTTAPTTITEAILSTALTLTSTKSSTQTSPSTTLSHSSPTTTTEKILSTFSTFFNNATSTEATNSTTTVEPVGCPATIDWCYYTPPLHLFQYILGCVIISAGYPTASVMSYALYSKILGPKPQGLWMGWLTASGSLARTLGPIFVSQIYYSFGPQITFGVDCGVILLTIVAVICVFRRLVPCKYTPDYPTPNGTPNNTVVNS